MGADSILPSLIQGGSDLASQGINAWTTGKMNKRQRQFVEHMYGRQRGDALDDWNRNNEYNSPAAQMARYRDAGLNPNLIYGQSNQAAPVRSTNADAWNPRAPQVDLGRAVGSGLSTYYDLQLKEATLDNLRAQNTVIKNEALLKDAQMSSLFANTERSKFDLALETELRDVSLQARTENLRKLTTDIDLSLNRDEREAAMNSSNLAEAVQRILSMKTGRRLTDAQIANIKNDSTLKQLDIELKQMGIQPGDNMFIRMAGRAVQKFDLKPRVTMRSNAGNRAIDAIIKK